MSDILDAIDDCYQLISLLQNSSEACKRTVSLIQQIRDYMTSQYGLQVYYDPLNDEYLIALLDELYALKGELQTDLQALADALGPQHANVLRDLCEFAAANPTLLYMSNDICSNITLMNTFMSNIQASIAVFNDELWPYGSEEQPPYWGLVVPHLPRGYLLMPFGREAVDITVAVMFNMTVPGEPLFRNVRLLTQIAAFICAPGPVAASEVYASYYTKNCSCPLVTYFYLPIALFDISNAFTHYVDTTGKMVELYAQTNEQSITNFWAERREGPGKSIDCSPVGDCYTDPVIIATTDTTGTAFQRLLGKMMDTWGMVFEDYHYSAGGESVDGWKGKELLKRHEMFFQPVGGTIGGGGLPIHIAPIIAVIEKSNIEAGNQSELIKYAVMYNGEQVEYNGEELVYL